MRSASAPSGAPATPRSPTFKLSMVTRAFFEVVPTGSSARMAYSSYGGVVGPWLVNTWSIPGVGSGARRTHSAIKGNQLGMFNVCSNVRIASVTDGTSNTMLFGEHAHGLLEKADQPSWQWWDSGNLGDTLITTMWPINPHRKIQDIATGELGGKIFIVSGSSFHPGGANFSFVDGSVRFIKDSVQSWPLQPVGQDLGGNALPVSVTATFAANGTSRDLGSDLQRDSRLPVRCLPGALDAKCRRSHQRRRLLIR